MIDISFDTCKCGAVTVSSATAVAELKADNERLRAALEGAAVQFANNNLPAFSHQCRAAMKKKT